MSKNTTDEHIERVVNSVWDKVKRLFRFIAKVAGYVNYNLQWYEHTDKN